MQNMPNSSQGMDKILWGMGNGSGTVEVTNDGATILRSVGVDNPAAKVFDLSDYCALISFVSLHLQRNLSFCIYAEFS